MQVWGILDIPTHLWSFASWWPLHWRVSQVNKLSQINSMVVVLLLVRHEFRFQKGKKIQLFNHRGAKKNLLLDNITNCRCEMKFVLLEMDRILCPTGYAIIRESTYFLDSVAAIAKGMRWSCERRNPENKTDKDKILICQKKLWAGKQWEGIVWSKYKKKESLAWMDDMLIHSMVYSSNVLWSQPPRQRRFTIWYTWNMNTLMYKNVHS